MILDETLSALRRLRPGIEGVRVARAVVGISFTGVQLDDGACGLAYTPEGAKSPRHRERSRARREPPPGALQGVRAMDAAAAKGEDPLAGALRLAAVNALCAPLLAGGRYRIVLDKDALDLMDASRMRSVVLVGAFRSYIERLRDLPRTRLRVLELSEDAVDPGDRGLFIPAAKGPEVLPEADAVLVTGAAIANGTMEGLLGLVNPRAQVAVVGPSGGILPDALFSRGVGLVSGALVTDPAMALELLSQGASAYHLFGRCARKMNLLPP